MGGPCDFSVRQIQVQIPRHFSWSSVYFWKLKLTMMKWLLNIFAYWPCQSNGGCVFVSGDIWVEVQKWNLKRLWTQLFQEPFLTCLETEVLWTAGLWCSHLELMRMWSLLWLKFDLVIATPSEIWRSSCFWKVTTLEYSKLSGSPIFSLWKISRCLAIPFLVFFLAPTRSPRSHYLDSHTIFVDSHTISR